MLLAIAGLLLEFENIFRVHKTLKVFLWLKKRFETCLIWLFSGEETFIYCYYILKSQKKFSLTLILTMDCLSRNIKIVGKNQFFVTINVKKSLYFWKGGFYVLIWFVEIFPTLNQRGENVMCIIESLIFAKISNNCCAFAPGIQELCPRFVENEI